MEFAVQVVFAICIQLDHSKESASDDHLKLTLESLRYCQKVIKDAGTYRDAMLRFNTSLKLKQANLLDAMDYVLENVGKKNSDSNGFSAGSDTIQDILNAKAVKFAQPVNTQIWKPAVDDENTLLRLNPTQLVQAMKTGELKPGAQVHITLS